MGNMAEVRGNVLLISVQENLSVLGLKYVHYSLLDDDWNSCLLHLPNFHPDRETDLRRLIAFVRDVDPLFIGFSLMSVEFERTRQVSDRLKASFPGLPFLWGGIHPTIAPETCFPHADYVLMGEGERSVLSFAHAVNDNHDVREIHGLCFLEDRKVRKNPVAQPIQQLDDLPPYEHVPKNGFLQKKNGDISPLDAKLLAKHDRFHGRIYDVLTSRGCPFACTYCCNNFLTKLYGSGKLRRRTASNIMEELERALQDHPDIETINFQDDSFLSASERYLAEFCKAYSERIGRPLLARSVPTAITENKLKILKEAGISWISTGLQTGSDRVAKEIYKRNSRKEDFLKAAALFKKFRIAAIYDVILDNPLETAEEKLETIEVLLRTPRPFYVNFFSLSLYLGTELHGRVSRECPDKMVNATQKDYLRPEKSVINTLTMLSPYIPRHQTEWLLKVYRASPDGPVLKMLLQMSKISSALLFSPLTYFRVLRSSQRGSLLKTFAVLGTYLRKILSRYGRQFG